MKYIRLIALMLCICMLCGCSAVASVIGTLSIDPEQVARLEVSHSGRGSFAVQDQEAVRKVVNLVNLFKLENGSMTDSASEYVVTLVDAEGNTVAAVELINEDAVKYDHLTYKVDAASLFYYVQTLECDTMTDKELIQQIFEIEYAVFSDLTDEDGSFSLDKFLKLKDKCPASFELISRSSALESLSSYGLDMLKAYMESDDNILRQRAQDIAAFFTAKFPSLAPQVEEIVEN